MTSTKVNMLANKLFSSLVKSPIQIRNVSSTLASITRIHRPIYCRMYPTVMVLPNGSSIRIRYHEPRKIITMPLDLTTLSESERKARIEARKPKRKIKVEEEVEDSFDSTKYLKYIKRK